MPANPESNVRDAHGVTDAHDIPGSTGLAPRLEALERMVVRQQESLDLHARLIYRLRMELLAMHRQDRSHDRDQIQAQDQRPAGKG